jgi:hypothetical protein
LNENSTGSFVFIVVTDKQFYIFEERLVMRSKHQLDSNYGKVTSVAFNQATTSAYLGTSKGFIVTWDLDKC